MDQGRTDHIDRRPIQSKSFILYASSYLDMVLERGSQAKSKELQLWSCTVKQPCFDHETHLLCLLPFFILSFLVIFFLQTCLLASDFLNIFEGDWELIPDSLLFQVPIVIIIVFF